MKPEFSGTLALVLAFVPFVVGVKGDSFLGAKARERSEKNMAKALVVRAFAWLLPLILLIVAIGCNGDGY